MRDYIHLSILTDVGLVLTRVDGGISCDATLTTLTMKIVGPERAVQTAGATCTPWLLLSPLAAVTVRCFPRTCPGRSDVKRSARVNRTCIMQHANVWQVMR